MTMSAQKKTQFTKTWVLSTTDVIPNLGNVLSNCQNSKLLTTRH